MAAAAPPPDAASIYVELYVAVAELRARCLYSAATWAAEALAALPEGVAEAAAGTAAAAAAAAPAAAAAHPLLLQGRCYLEDKEYLRAAHVLRAAPGPVAAFLRLYAIWLAGEEDREQARIEAFGQLGAGGPAPPNPHADSLAADLGTAVAPGGVLEGDGCALYLAGVVASDGDEPERAKGLLAASLRAFPCNWAAWSALLLLCGASGAEPPLSLGLPAHWTAHCFSASLCLELQRNAEALSRLQVVNQLLPRSDWVSATAAEAHYAARSFGPARALLEELRERDPHRVANMDTYSNILFVCEDAVALSHLAHGVSRAARHRAAACCVLGNYHGLKGQHERAVEWFRRALRLDRCCVAAWTLMGHEYVEMRNAPAAIDAYRSAVDLCPRDYRAWYGLGQAYELLGMAHYALHYYRRATLLRPEDARMWAALGSCYESEGLALPSLALRCYRRAVAHGDREGLALARLAELHASLGQPAASAHYHALVLSRLDTEGGPPEEAATALLALAEYCRDTGALSDAEAYCQRLIDLGGTSAMRAKALLRELRAGASGSAGAKQPLPLPLPPPPALGGGRSTLPLPGRAGGARRVLGDASSAAAAGGGGGWVTSTPHQGNNQQQHHHQQQQQQQGPAPGVVQAGDVQQSPVVGSTPGTLSVHMEDDDSSGSGSAGDGGHHADVADGGVRQQLGAGAIGLHAAAAEFALLGSSALDAAGGEGDYSDGVSDSSGADVSDGMALLLDDTVTPPAGVYGGGSSGGGGGLFAAQQQPSVPLLRRLDSRSALAASPDSDGIMEMATPLPAEAPGSTAAAASTAAASTAAAAAPRGRRQLRQGSAASSVRAPRPFAFASASVTPAAAGSSRSTRGGGGGGAPRPVARRTAAAQLFVSPPAAFSGFDSPPSPPSAAVGTGTGLVVPGAPRARLVGPIVNGIEQDIPRQFPRNAAEARTMAEQLAAMCEVGVDAAAAVLQHVGGDMVAALNRLEAGNRGASHARRAG